MTMMWTVSIDLHYACVYVKKRTKETPKVLVMLQICRSLRLGSSGSRCAIHVEE
jgi:hypothetical protein